MTFCFDETHETNDFKTLYERFFRYIFAKRRFTVRVFDKIIANFREKMKPMKFSTLYERFFSQILAHRAPRQKSGTL